jgi:ParB family chromosome partitioning protein
MSNGLGRGLSSLIPPKVKKEAAMSNGEAVVNVSSKEDKDKVLQIDLDKINFNPMQPRKRFTDYRMEELMESIRRYGIIQPLIVSRVDGNLPSAEASEGKFELIAGERRLRAAKALNLEKVPVIVRDTSEQDKLEVALVENLQREDLNPVETALAYRKLIDEFNLSQEEVAKRVGRSRPSVSNTLRVLNLPEEIQLALIEGRITEGHAKILTGLESEEKQMVLFRKMLNTGMSVNDATQEARRMGGTKQARVKINYADKDKEFAFREFFKSKVEIKRKGKGGQIIIDFYSDEELEEMTKKIKN